MPCGGQALRRGDADARVYDLEPAPDARRVLGRRERGARRHRRRDAVRRDSQWRLPARRGRHHGAHLPAGRGQPRRVGRDGVRPDLRADEEDEEGEACLAGRVCVFVCRQDGDRHRLQGDHRPLRDGRDRAAAREVPPAGQDHGRLQRQPYRQPDRGVHVQHLVNPHAGEARRGQARQGGLQGGHRKRDLRERRRGGGRPHHAQRRRAQAVDRPHPQRVRDASG
mmetsp:Transcript_12842/g.41026  ORF Transcript_12842/g.41026 Transcript_12842/m.41026 type:complete len:224 (+) Transcript_12842:858-1529(+)